MFARNQAFCLKNWNLWQVPTTIGFNISCWNFAHVFYILMSTKECSISFLFCLDLELFAKIKKGLVSTHSFFTVLLINNSTPLKTLLSRKRVQNVSKIIWNFVTVGARQSFQFFIQIAWLLGYNRTLSKFRYTFLFMKNGFLTLAPKMV